MKQKVVFQDISRKMKNYWSLSTNYARQVNPSAITYHSCVTEFKISQRVIPAAVKVSFLHETQGTKDRLCCQKQKYGPSTLRQSVFASYIYIVKIAVFLSGAWCRRVLRF